MKKKRGIQTEGRWEDGMRQRLAGLPSGIRGRLLGLDKAAIGIRRAGKAIREGRDESNGGIHGAYEGEPEEEREEQFFHCFNPKVDCLCQFEAKPGSG
jgi:hypothetical protein